MPPPGPANCSEGPPGLLLGPPGPPPSGPSDANFFIISTPSPVQVGIKSSGPRIPNTYLSYLQSATKVFPNCGGVISTLIEQAFPFSVSPPITTFTKVSGLKVDGLHARTLSSKHCPSEPHVKVCPFAAASETSALSTSCASAPSELNITYKTFSKTTPLMYFKSCLNSTI